ncbi:neuronal acetylcholine receptor subunit alpha-6-like [Patella vulgata]|uniref:neuronal acetylcholine receptor subunit alpha-6-like n=1 Tax=Patella vulgata TaxID=6465 RepID=UPI0024A9D516|nr:neuronal acetylcholine receptor subunit alpha-6-like [Patella vulgata]
MILNSVDKRDVFSDELHPYIVQWDGTVFWTPTAVFRTYCNLDMTKFPFDVQRCTIFSRVGVTLILARRPAFIVLNVCLPIAVLSLLNVAVFRVPIDSGEKLSYVLTVLLALAVFMSIVGGMLPTTSTTIPLLTIYLSSLLGFSTCSALLTVYIMSVAHRPESRPVPKPLKLLVVCMNGRKPRDRIQPLNEDAKINWKVVSEALDKLCLYLSTSLVLATSLGVAITITNARN